MGQNPIANDTGAPARSVGELDKLIGARLRLVRHNRGLTQEQLAQRVGLTFQQMQKYEKGANRISCSTLVMIAKALDAHPSEILPHLADGSETPEFISKITTALPLIEAYAAIESPKIRAAILDLVIRMAETSATSAHPSKTGRP